jgi:hypothetical protein
MNTTDPYPHLPIPAGAEDVCEWDDPGTSGAMRRFISKHRVIDFDLGDGSRRWTEDFAVYVEGIQYPDGRIDRREIVLGPLHPDNPITIEQAEQLTAALAEATQAARAAEAIDGGLSDPESTIA